MWKVSKKDEKKFMKMLNKKKSKKKKPNTSKLYNEEDLRKELNNGRN